MATITDYIDGNGKAVQRTDYSQPSTPRADNVSHSYTPPNHDTGRGWAFDDALEACIASTMVGGVLGLVAATVASRLVGMGLLGTVGVFSVVFALPFVFPIEIERPFNWRNPFLAYSKTRWIHQQIFIEYHEAAIERLRPVTTPEPTVAGARTATPDLGDMLYLQCAAVLARATVDPRCPRDAESAVRTKTKSGIPVVVTKDEYKDVAGMLCFLGFMVGGEGDEDQRNYALAAAWQGKSVSELWAALKPHKAVIMAWAV